MRWVKTNFFLAIFSKGFIFIFNFQTSRFYWNHTIKKTARLAFSKANIHYKYQILKRTLEIHNYNK